VMLERMHEVARSHPSVARIDGRGLHWTVEVHGPDWRDWRGEEAEPIASRVAARAMDAGVLFSTSAEQTSLFVAPPLIVEDGEVARIFDALHHGLELADQERT
jgi:4-aminobutyrate aminotransferase-like enzyme